MSWLSALGLKKSLVECATVCTKSEVTLMYIVYKTYPISYDEHTVSCFSVRILPIIWVIFCSYAWWIQWSPVFLFSSSEKVEGADGTFLRFFKNVSRIQDEKTDDHRYLLKVRLSQNELMKSLILQNSNWKIWRISALASKTRSNKKNVLIF